MPMKKCIFLVTSLVKEENKFKIYSLKVGLAADYVDCSLGNWRKWIGVILTILRFTPDIEKQ